MARVLFLTEAEITKTTILSGNVDVDLYIPCILDTQDIQIQRLLGTELYDKMYDYAKNEIEPTGLYLELRDEYIKPITKFSAVAMYITLANYNVKGGGIFKNLGENKEVVQKSEIDVLSGIYTAKADAYIIRFEKWIKQHSVSIPEYKNSQDEVDPSNDMSKNSSLWI